MSTIFDALKRSDRERQLNTTHTMSYSHLHTEEKSTTWMKYLVLLIGVLFMIGVASYFAIKNDTVNQTEVTQVDMMPANSISPVAATISKESNNAVASALAVESKRVLQNTEEKAVDETPLALNNQRPRQSLAELTKAPVVAPIIQSETPKQTISSINESSNESIIDSTIIENTLVNYDNYSAIRASQNLPELHLDILIYHPNVTQRKAFINLNSYRQGDVTQEGVKVLTISEQGVLLNYQGKDFVLRTN